MGETTPPGALRDKPKRQLFKNKQSSKSITEKKKNPKGGSTNKGERGSRPPLRQTEGASGTKKGKQP